MTFGRSVVAIALALLAGCGGDGAPFPPAPVAGLEQPAEYAWGDAVAARDEALARHVGAALGPRFGRARETHHVARPDALPSLRAAYTARLGEGWTPLPLPLGPGESGFAMSDGKRALAVAWLPAQPGGRVPVTVFAYR